MTRPLYTGNAAVFDGVLIGHLKCTFGSVTRFRGEPKPDGGWTLTVTGVTFPPDMAVPLLDEP